MRYKLLLLLFSAGLSTTHSQTFNKARLDSFFDILEKNNKAMGSLALSHNGRIIYKRSVGFCDISDPQKKCNENTRYRVGSITKMFTAVMALQLIEEGKLRERQKLSDFFPSVPNAEKISVYDLLHHRSGLHSITSDSTYLQWLHEPRTKEQLVALMEKSKPRFKPGERAEYSNSNFILLGYIIEKITEKSYAENLKVRITSPLQLANTYYGGKIDINNNESYSYLYINNWEKDRETDMSIPGGAGAIVSTPVDLTIFIESLFSGKLVSSSGLEKMKNIQEGYGMGMLQFPFYDRKAFGHTGGIDAFHSILAHFPSDSLSIAYCANGEVYSINDILKTVLAEYYDKPYSLPEFVTVNLTEKDISRYVGEYSSKMMPLKITISAKKNVLFAQATNQPMFPLEATAPNKFKFDKAALVMEFDPDKKEMVLKQGGGVYLFTKD